MATTDFIAAIELGSCKLAGVAGKKNSDGSLQILAYAQEPSTAFVRQGGVYNIDKAAQALGSIVARLEGQLGNSIAKVYAGIGGQWLHTVTNCVERTADEEAPVTQELVDAIGDENLAMQPAEPCVVDVAPQEYLIDGTLQADPVGVPGRRISARFLNIVTRISLKKNLERSFQQARIQLADLFVSPLALAQAVLTEGERRAGCALVDMGADTTTVSVYKQGLLRYLCVLPLGGRTITRDITTLQMEEEEAEALKLRYGNALCPDGVTEEEEGIATAAADGCPVDVEKLNDVVSARAEEILANVWNQLQLSGYADKLLAGVVLTGGACNLRNTEEAWRRISKLEKVKSVRSILTTVHGCTDLLPHDATHCTLLALLAKGDENCCLQEQPTPAATANQAAAAQEDGHTADIFGNDEELKRQEEAARSARMQREREERERRERERREREQRKQRERKQRGPNWLERTIGKLSGELFDDDKLN